jgi:hypothetical protein
MGWMSVCVGRDRRGNMYHRQLSVRVRVRGVGGVCRLRDTVCRVWLRITRRFVTIRLPLTEKTKGIFFFRYNSKHCTGHHVSYHWTLKTFPGLGHTHQPLLWASLTALHWEEGRVRNTALPSTVTPVRCPTQPYPNDTVQDSRGLPTAKKPAVEHNTPQRDGTVLTAQGDNQNNMRRQCHRVAQ